MVRIPKIRKGDKLASIKRQRTARLTKLATRAALLQRRGHNDEAYTLVCNEFVSLGGIYVKFLQGILLNSPVMKRWHSPNKLKIFEGLNSEELDIVKLLHQELNSEQLAQIAKLQTTPFAAGSFGQVYYGELATGQPIIVKALRPQVRQLLQHDLRLIGLFSRFFVNRHYKNVDMKLDDAVKDFRRATLAETDYMQEAHFADEMYEMNRHNPDLVIPKTYLELCTPQLIVQDYIAGISCAEVLQQQASHKTSPTEYVKSKTGSDLHIQLQSLGVALLNGCFEQQRIMGDPHPGNVRLLPDNKIALVDFGISAPSPRNRAAFYGLMREWSKMYMGTLDVPALFEQGIRMFVNDLYRALKKITSMRPQQAEAMQQNMLKNVGGIIQELFDGEGPSEELDEAMDQLRLVGIFNNVINKGNRLGLVVKFEDSEFLRAAQTYMSTVESLGLRAEVLPYVFNTVVKHQQSVNPGITHNTERQPTVSQALEIINSWLERVASKDPMLFRRLLQQMSAAGYGTVKVAQEVTTKVSDRVAKKAAETILDKPEGYHA